MTHEVGQPYAYKHREVFEPDWTRLPGYADVTAAEWENVQWQRTHCVKNIAQLKAVMGDLLDESFYTDLEKDQQNYATMSMLVPPQMLNTMVPMEIPNTESFYADPIRRYMFPVFSDRRTDWPTHPMAQRDSLHEQDMWACEGLTHRYPDKVLAELLITCPQYCGHCTRMDLVGNNTLLIEKDKLVGKRPERFQAMIDYLKINPQVRDVVVSGGDVANLPWPHLEEFVNQLLELDNVRDIRLATKALIALPQHWYSDDVLAGVERLCTKANKKGTMIAVHTHANSWQSVTPLVAKAVRGLLDAGIRDVRNQGVLMRGVNATTTDLLDLCFNLLDGANITPYYFYMCDMIPYSEHWRVSLAEAQNMQHAMLGYLPGFATPRIVCDVPYVGKRWVHMMHEYDTDKGVSYWQKNYRTGIEKDDDQALGREYVYYDPIYTLPEAGQQWWRDHSSISAEELAKLATVDAR